MSDVPLGEHVAQRLRDLELRLSEQRDDLKDRLGAMNEFREALRDQSAQMATRHELEVLRLAIEQKLTTQRELLTQSRIQVAGLAAAVSLAAYIFSRVATEMLTP